MHAINEATSDLSLLTQSCEEAGDDAYGIVLPASSAWVLVHADHCVQLGLLGQGGQSLDMEDSSACDPAYLKELRVFTVSAELHLVRTKKGFQGRIRCDSSREFEGGEQACVYHEDDLMWGRVQTCSMGQALVDADRGVNIPLPRGVSIQQGVRLKYRHIDYVRFDDHGTTEILDSRLAGILADLEG
jgi:CRISPR-associated protein (TIGR03984 family)